MLRFSNLGDAMRRRNAFIEREAAKLIDRGFAPYDAIERATRAYAEQQMNKKNVEHLGNVANLLRRLQSADEA